MLRKALVRSPHDVTARKLLETAQELELKRLVSDDEPGKRKVFESSSAPGISAREPGLDWLADESGNESETPPTVDPSIEIGPRARIDLAIAYLEMGFPERAARELLAARGAEGFQKEADFLRVVAVSAAGDPLGALHLSEGLLRGEELTRPERVELWYQAALACETLGVAERARAFFRQVLALEPHYREAAARLRKLEDS